MKRTLRCIHRSSMGPRRAFWVLNRSLSLVNVVVWLDQGSAFNASAAPANLMVCPFATCQPALHFAH